MKYLESVSYTPKIRAAPRYESYQNSFARYLVSMGVWAQSFYVICSAVLNCCYAILIRPQSARVAWARFLHSARCLSASTFSSISIWHELYLPHENRRNVYANIVIGWKWDSRANYVKLSQRINAISWRLFFGIIGLVWMCLVRQFSDCHSNVLEAIVNCRILSTSNVGNFRVSHLKLVNAIARTYPLNPFRLLTGDVWLMAASFSVDSAKAKKRNC